VKVLLVCLECLNESGLYDFQPIVVNVNDERYFIMTCPKGHQTLTFIQQPKYKVLFELGMNALVDGYPREAVTSFASCLENFYEFCINQVALHKGVNQTSLSNAWNSMAKQSERQLGAFVMLSLSHFGSSPTLLNNNSRNFRNRVVHQGYIPELDEALGFGNDIVACVAANLRDMQSHFGDDLDIIFTNEFLDRVSKQKQKVTTQFIPTTINWSELVQEGYAVDLNARMKEIEKNKILFQWPKA
jgi:hypothetical protein